MKILPLPFPLLFAFLSLLFIVILKKATNKFAKRNRNSRLPPGPRKLPIIGNLHQFLLAGSPHEILKWANVGNLYQFLVGDLPHEILRNWAKEHGPLMHLQLGEVSAVVVSSAKGAEQVMKTHGPRFADRVDRHSAKILTYGCKGVVFAPYGDYWRQMRKVFVSELLSAKRVQSFRSVREEEVCNLIKSISLMGAESQTINLSKRIYSFTEDVIFQAVLGHKCDPNEDFMSWIEQANNLVGGYDISDLFPSSRFLRIISRLNPSLKNLFREVDKILGRIIRTHLERRAALKDNNMREDLVDVFLRVQEQGGLNFPITNESIKAAIFEIFAGGTDPLSSTAEWAMSEMLKNPRVMDKAQAEVRRVMNLKGKIDESELHELKYLKLVINETLRMHPPFPLIPRVCRERCEIDGYEIPTGTLVIISAAAIGRDPGQWHNAETFEPERFDGLPIDYKGTHFEFIPFGAGRRMCPGIVFGMANLELLLAQLLYHFDWKLPNGVGSKDLDMMGKFGAILRRRNSLYLTPVPYIIPDQTISQRGISFSGEKWRKLKDDKIL